MLPWSFRGRTAQKYMPQLQHNMWVDERHNFGALRSSQARQMGRDRDRGRFAYQHFVVTAEKKFWRCVPAANRVVCSASSRRGRRIEASRVVDMIDPTHGGIRRASSVKLARRFCSTRMRRPN